MCFLMKLLFKFLISHSFIMPVFNRVDIIISRRFLTIVIYIDLAPLRPRDILLELMLCSTHSRGFCLASLADLLLFTHFQLSVCEELQQSPRESGFHRNMSGITDVLLATSQQLNSKSMSATRPLVN